LIRLSWRLVGGGRALEKFHVRAFQICMVEAEHGGSKGANFFC
jgi:hypothetical protein